LSKNSLLLKMMVLYLQDFVRWEIKNIGLYLNVLYFSYLRYLSTREYGCLSYSTNNGFKTCLYYISFYPFLNIPIFSSWTQNYTHKKKIRSLSYNSSLTRFILWKTKDNNEGMLSRHQILTKCFLLVTLLHDNIFVKSSAMVFNKL